MIHDLQEYTKAGFEITFYYADGLKVDVWNHAENTLIYCGWSFGEACLEMDAYLKEKHEP